MESTPCCKYNWDDLDVGKIDANHSEKFFRFKHEKHEKINEDIYFKKQLYTRCFKSPTSNKENDKDLFKSFGLKLLIEDESTNNKNKIKTEQNNLKCNLPNILTEQRNIKNPSNNIKYYKVPHVYEYGEIYEKKKQEKLQKLQEEEEKKRQFHSKPAPKFNNKAKIDQVNQQQNFKQTIPFTPAVLKRSKEIEENRKKKIEKVPSYNFVSSYPKVLHEEPFKPKKKSHIVETKPFNLLVEKRLEERKQFDERIKKLFEEKKKQNQEEKERKEKEMISEIRKLTNFKARPNPFRH